MAAPYDANAIANYFLELGWRDSNAISPMKIQKLVYFAHGWHLGLASHPLINETVQAWQYGPVIASLYHGFKSFGNQAITQLGTASRLDGNTIIFSQPEVDSDDGYVRGLLNRIWEVYGKFSPHQLSVLTHQVGTPWEQVWHPELPVGTTIDPGSIRDFFEERLKD